MLAARMGNNGSILALDRDPKRLKRLQDNAEITGSKIITAHCQDFLLADPHSPEFAAVQGILLDPSCSGSGTVRTLHPYAMTLHYASGWLTEIFSGIL